MQEIRCGACSRKLGEGTYVRLSIKCPRCGAVNQLRAEDPHSERQRTPIETRDARSEANR